jgi:hypothetical protein
LNIAGISEEAKTKATELRLDQNQSALEKIAKADGTDAQLRVIDEIQSGKASGADSGPPDRPKPKKKKLLKPPTEDALDSDQQEQEQEEVASPSLSPESNEESDHDREAVEESDTSNDSTEKDHLFDELKAAWDNAPKSVRKRFVRKVLRLDADEINEEIWTS